MNQKRKMSEDFEEQERAPKKFKPDSHSNNTTLLTVPDDCLREIFIRLPSMSQRAVSFTAKRFHSIYEAIILQDLSTTLDTTLDTLPKPIKEIFYPRGQYLAFEKVVRMAEENNDVDAASLENLLGRLNRQITLKISEKLNNRRLQDQLSEEMLSIIQGKVGYKEISPVNVFDLLKDTNSSIYGGKFHVSFYLFGQKGQFVEVSCDVYSFYDQSGGSFTCDLKMTAKLMSIGSTECTDVEGLFEGYKECYDIPESEEENQDEDRDADDDEQNDEEEDDEDSEERFKKQVKRGDRVKREWFHDCYPTLDKKKLDQVRKWLGWEMSTLDFAKVLVGLSMKPELEGYALDIDTTNTKASLESLLKKMLSEDESQWLNEVERTLDLLTAKTKLKNRITKEWSEKEQAKVNQINALIDRSMYTRWSRVQGEHDANPEEVVYYKELNGEIKLISEDPSKWIRFNFVVNTCRRGDPNSLSDDDRHRHSISTSKTDGIDCEYFCESWTVSESEVKLIKEELGLGTFTNEEIVELLAMAADHPLDEISLEIQEHN
eukprot:TRINITY_DN431_c0_g2_i1.p1 TRINITY_DN431_c0_g2~~TRINITY_DN431_c0_g2_i1.p1  ORF type:complete len:546 (+),score=92.43 TRINITY_DN431_c0_g2_i1:181-1818(+)